MTKKIDELQLKISGKVSTDKPLEIDAEVEFSGKGSVVKIETGSNQDGTVNECFVIKPYEINIK